MGLEEQPPALSVLLLGLAPGSWGKTQEEWRVLGNPGWLEGGSFLQPPQAELCQDRWDTEPVWVAGGCAAVGLPSSAHPQGWDQALCRGLMPRWCCCGGGWGSSSRFCRRSHLSNKLSRNPGSHPARNLDLEPKVTLGPYCQHRQS